MSEILLEHRVKNNTAPVRPFIYERPSVSSVCIRILVLLFVQILCLLVTKSYQALYVVLSTLLGSVCAVALIYLISKDESYKIFTTLIQGIFIGMFLPSTYPVVPAFFISFLCLFLSRSIVFKNLNSWVNISAVAVIIAWFIGRNYFPDFIITSDIISLKNSSMYLIQNGSFPIYDFDIPVTSFLNNNIFKYFNVTLPEGYVSLFVDTQSVIPAFRFNLITIISAIIIFSDNAFSEIIPLAFLIVYGVLVRVFVPFVYGGHLNQGDVILAFLTSGTLFCGVFMIQWFGTTPITVVGKIIFGVLAGVFAFITSGCGTSPVGMVYTILICNIISLMIRVLEEFSNKAIVSKNVSKYLTGEKIK